MKVNISNGTFITTDNSYGFNRRTKRSLGKRVGIAPKDAVKALKPKVNVTLDGDIPDETQVTINRDELLKREEISDDLMTFIELNQNCKFITRALTKENKDDETTYHLFDITDELAIEESFIKSELIIDSSFLDSEDVESGTDVEIEESK